jgi:hypothetical protein
LKSPGWQGGAHQDEHDAQHHEQGRHRIPTLSALTP